MIDIAEYIKKGYTLEKTNLSFPDQYIGKVRDNLILDDGRRVSIVCDRLSAFDRVITAIPLKGQILNETTKFWFEKTSKIPNHMLSVPDPNVMIVKECKPLSVEMVIRGYITGSAWRAYEKDPNAAISGITFPKGLKKNQKLDKPVITPTTKAKKGHDEAISREEIIEKKKVDEDIYKQMEEYTRELFRMGTEISGANGLILVDTKYEFGIDKDGKLVVIDEIHTPDSSRYWMMDTYQAKFDGGESPKALDKEFVRDWLRDEKNFTGDGDVPEVDIDVKVELSNRYQTNYKLVTGLNVTPPVLKDGEMPIDRIKAKLTELGILK